MKPIDAEAYAAESERLAKAFVAQGAPQEIDPGTLGLLTGLLEGLAAEGRSMKIWEDNAGVHVVLSGETVPWSSSSPCCRLA